MHHKEFELHLKNSSLFSGNEQLLMGFKQEKVTCLSDGYCCPVEMDGLILGMDNLRMSGYQVTPLDKA